MSVHRSVSPGGRATSMVLEPSRYNRSKYVGESQKLSIWLGGVKEGLKLKP